LATLSAGVNIIDSQKIQNISKKPNFSAWQKSGKKAANEEALMKNGKKYLFKSVLKILFFRS
jgi:hypothetical protein